MTKEELRAIFPDNKRSFSWFVRLIDPNLALEDSCFPFHLFKYHRRLRRKSFFDLLRRLDFLTGSSSLAFFVLLFFLTPFLSCLLIVVMIVGWLWVPRMPKKIRIVHSVPNYLRQLHPSCSTKEFSSDLVFAFSRFSPREFATCLYLERMRSALLLFFVSILLWTIPYLEISWTWGYSQLPFMGDFFYASILTGLYTVVFLEVLKVVVSIELSKSIILRDDGSLTCNNFAKGHFSRLFILLVGSFFIFVAFAIAEDTFGPISRFFVVAFFIALILTLRRWSKSIIQTFLHNLDNSPLAQRPT